MVRIVKYREQISESVKNNSLKVSDTITFNVNQKDRIANRFIIYAILRNVGKLLPRKESLDPSSSKYGCNTDRSATKQTKINPIFPLKNSLKILSEIFSKIC